MECWVIFCMFTKGNNFILDFCKTVTIIARYNFRKWLLIHYEQTICNLSNLIYLKYMLFLKKKIVIKKILLKSALLAKTFKSIFFP